MQAHLKNALMTTGLVLLTIYVIRKTPAKGLVDQALAG